MSAGDRSLLTEMLAQEAIQELGMALQLLHQVGGLLLCQIAITDSLIECSLDSVGHQCM
jgi:hypothetical protein